MEKMKAIRDKFIDLVMCQMEDLDKIDAEEMGEVIDIIKDLEEAMYYHTFVNKNIEEQRLKEMK